MAYRNWSMRAERTRSYRIPQLVGYVCGQFRLPVCDLSGVNREGVACAGEDDDAPHGQGLLGPFESLGALRVGAQGNV
jgi:hypothetical protein